MTETLVNGYSSESTHQELSNEYQHDRVSMIFKNLCILVLWKKVALALEGLRGTGTGTGTVSKSTVLYIRLFLKGTFMDTNCCEVIIN